jgi:hypothetical protein
MSTFSEQLQLSEHITWCFTENEEVEDKRMAAFENQRREGSSFLVGVGKITSVYRKTVRHSYSTGPCYYRTGTTEDIPVTTQIYCY